MMRSEAITIIKRGLGFRQTQDAAIVAALQQAQRDLEHGKTLPNWMLEFDAAMPVTANVSTVTTPSLFLRLHEEYQPYYLDTTGNRVYLPRKNLMEALDAYKGSTLTLPQVFVLLNNTTIKLIPTPVTSFTMWLTYYMGEPILSSEIENAWLKFAPNYIVGMAGMSVAGDLRDAGALQKFSSMAKMGAQAFFGDVVEEELAGRPLIMGRNN